MNIDFFIKKGYKIVKSPENFILNRKGNFIRSPLQINYNGVSIYYENKKEWDLNELNSYIVRIILKNEREVKINSIIKKSRQ